MEPSPNAARRLARQCAAIGLTLSCALAFTTTAEADGNQNAGPIFTSKAQRGRLQPGESVQRDDFPVPGGRVGTAETSIVPTGVEATCGNAQLDEGETCDDGNSVSRDGCSDTCQVEEAWLCTDPIPPGELTDPGFELGTPNPYWSESSTNFRTPICNELDCGLGTGSGPASGDFWAWFGGIEVYDESSLQRSLTFPVGATTMTFQLELSACDSGSDYLELLLDNNLVYFINGASPLCGALGYVTQRVDIRAYADGNPHSLVFHAETFANNLDVTNIFVDDLAIPPTPSVCTVDPRDIRLRDGFESSDAMPKHGSGQNRAP